MPRGLLENRYLRYYKGGVQVRIVRLKVNYSRKFQYRAHGGKDLAIAKARRHRDRAYQEIFGIALTESSHLLKPRGMSEYPVGVSPVRNDKEEIIAFISSWQNADGGTERIYTPVIDGMESQAVNKALDIRLQGLMNRETELQNTNL